MGSLTAAGLSFASFGISAGTWFMLEEADTGFSKSRVHHPWILTVDHSPRQALAHGCPRTRSRNDHEYRHEPHALGHEPTCQLNDVGWILTRSQQPLDPSVFDHGYRSCTEPSEQVLKDVQALSQSGRP